MSSDLLALDAALHDLATLYQFRSLDDPTYRALTVSQWYCLRQLAARSPLAMSELAAGLDVRVSTMTGVVDQLEKKGLVVRAHHPRDGRSLHVGLTSKGRRLYHAAHEAFLSHLAALLDTRPADERKRLLSFLAAIADAITGWRRNPRKIRRRAATRRR